VLNSSEYETVNGSIVELIETALEMKPLDILDSSEYDTLIQHCRTIHAQNDIDYSDFDNSIESIIRSEIDVDPEQDQNEADDVNNDNDMPDNDDDVQDYYVQ
jgi:hypothetical protein